MLKTCSLFVHDFQRLVNNLLMTCSWFVHNLFMTCSYLVHDLLLPQDSFTTCSWNVHIFSWLFHVFLTTCSQFDLLTTLLIDSLFFFHNLSMTCSWLAQKCFKICSWLVYYLFIPFSWIFRDLFTTCSWNVHIFSWDKSNKFISWRK